MRSRRASLPKASSGLAGRVAVGTTTGLQLRGVEGAQRLNATSPSAFELASACATSKPLIKGRLALARPSSGK
jgi:hypothetical protein